MRTPTSRQERKWNLLSSLNLKREMTLSSQKLLIVGCGVSPLFIYFVNFDFILAYL